MESNQFDIQESENNFDLLEQLFRYLRYWHYFLISVVLCFFVVKYYLNHTISIYESKSSVKIVDDSSNNFVLPTNGISLFPRTKINLDNQIAVLQSYRILEQVCRSLDLNTQYYDVGYFNNLEIWKNRPFTVDWLGSSLQMDNKAVSFEIEMVEGGYKITNFNGKEIDKTIPFNTVQHLNNIAYRLKLQVGMNKKSLLGRKYLISHSTVSASIIDLSNSLKIVNTNENSDILSLSIKGSNKDKSEAVINELIKQFDMDGLNDRRLIYQRTIDFVNNRFKSLERELDSIETRKATYKRSNELTFLEADALTETTRKVTAKNDVFQIETQIALSKILDQAIKSDKKYGLIPSNVGVLNADINQLITDYNLVVLERDRYLVSAGLNNPRVKMLSARLVDMQKNILVSIKAYEDELEVSLSKNDYIKKGTYTKVSEIPDNEKVLNGIERQRTIKETLYVLLLQKREEAAVNLAITSSSIKVVDYAITDATPVSPKKSAFYMGSIIVGLLIPFLILYTRFLLDDKLHTKEDMIKYTRNKIILSEIPHIDTEDRLTGVNDRSLLGESFRILRTNLSYVLPLKTDALGQTVMVTSTIKGEGKTFTALNLSISFSLMNKKILLIGADLRNPQLHNYLNIKKNEIGLQDYLHEISIDWRDIIKKNQLDNSNLDIILSGNIPPNPAELLSNGRLEKLIEEAKREYDFIIIDTAPTLLVTDTLLISQLVDTTLYVVRSGFTPKKILEFSVGLSDRNKLKNMVYVINNIGMNYGYGYKYGYSYKYKYSYAYGYGYGYGNEGAKKKSLVNKVLSVFKKK